MRSLSAWGVTVKFEPAHLINYSWVVVNINEKSGAFQIFFTRSLEAGLKSVEKRNWAIFAEEFYAINIHDNSLFKAPMFLSQLSLTVRFGEN